ncbi:MAG TPA: tripartite tricarboxylate transporter substrate-binding protein [Burkholderiaceae bacterium]|nr:tripartite tricarboxylate transporter substrate-binding protein [Burkholderiaceae bacterium]
MRVLKHFAAVAVTVWTTAMLGSAAVAQTWPSKPVTIIVPLPPGGPVDAVAREFARHLADDIKQPVVVENVAGAYGQIGLSRLHRAAPDGHTLGITGPRRIFFSIAVCPWRNLCLPTLT